MNCIGLIKFITGIFLALALLFVGGAAAARYLITRLTAPPPKPVFAEEQTIQEPESTLGSESANQEALTAGEQTNTTASEETPPQPLEVFTEPEPEAPEGVINERANARITQPIGMVLRQGPSQDTTQIGGLYFNDEVIMMGESADGQWQNVRLPGSGVEGWIKAGNTERLN